MSVLHLLREILHLVSFLDQSYLRRTLLPETYWIWVSPLLKQSRYTWWTWTEMNCNVVLLLQFSFLFLNFHLKLLFLRVWRNTCLLVNDDNPVRQSGNLDVWGEELEQKLGVWLRAAHITQPIQIFSFQKKYNCGFMQILSHASHKCMYVEIHSHFQKHSPASAHITQPIQMYVLNKYICKLDELLSRVHTNHSIASVRKLLPNKCILVSGKIHFWIVVEVLKYCVSCLRRFPAC